MKKTFLALNLCLLSFFTGAQPDPNAGVNPSATALMGTVVDAETGLPLDYATISLFAQADDKLITGTITEADGTFRLEAKAGAYYAKIEFIAYAALRVDDFVLDPSEVLDLGTLQLRPAAAALEQVTVTAERSQMELSLDKKVFNVGKDLGSRGGSAVDLLDNVPSVQVDVEGNVSLRGSGNVRILVNGRPSGLVGNGAGGLRSLPANLIERVEIVTNPSAAYEAEGTAGIINIVLKKEVRKGLNGSFDLNTGVPDNHGVAINLNRRATKLNFFTNLGLNYRRSPGDGSLYQEVFGPNETIISRQSNLRERSGLGGSFRFGADYFFDERNTLTTALTYRLGFDDNQNLTTYRDFINTLANPTAIETRLDLENEDERESEYALNYKLTFPQREGQQLTADLRYQDKTETEGSDLLNRFFNPDFSPNLALPNLQQRSNNEETENTLIFQSDYSHPFSKDHKLEAGVRASIRNIDNDFLVEELNPDDNRWNALAGLSNNFRYDENIFAAYLTYGNKYGKFSYQLGLRPELSQSTPNCCKPTKSTNAIISTSFPLPHFNYELPGQNAVQISYSRRVQRPRFWDLNPFFTFTDNRNFFSGNPNLDPEFSHSIELGHLKYFGKGSLSSSLYYRHTEGVVQRIRTVDAAGNSNTRPENLATEDALGLELTAAYDFAKWWLLQHQCQFFSLPD
ncbi:MAG: TonB-dependent receptor [Lewinella sp.]|nr:TonB-dependent receptor [Lewinella sp.]